MNLVLSAGRERARSLFRRVAERLADACEEPRLSFSSGLPIYPNDGDTSNEFPDAADCALYAMKVERWGKPSKRGELPARSHGRL
jgi:GGDEF domain-containing protein